MFEFNCDLHIHSPHSIAVSQKLNLDTMKETADKKGLHLLSTGDITQPDWRKYLQENLSKDNGVYSYNDLSFIIGTELEDAESLHHVVLLPDFRAAENLQEILTPHVKNITGKWAGRPHVRKSPAEVVEIIEDVGGICGPAHAFTPFKSVFRQNRFATLEEAYGTSAKKLAFLELGLSADTNLADRMGTLQDITFLSNSDAHSESPYSLGREFNKILLEEPSFDEIKKAMLRRQGRKVTLNVGLDPRLGKYNIMFCRSCRRRIKRTINPDIKISENKKKSDLSAFVKLGNSSDYSYNLNIDGEFIIYEFKSEGDHQRFLNDCSKEIIRCPACKEKIDTATDKKKKRRAPPLKLGVSERINQISTWDEPHHPDHRPPYLDIIPLIDLVRKMLGIKTKTSKSIIKTYNSLIESVGQEYDILYSIPTDNFSSVLDGKLSSVIEAFRNNEITFVPGGGGSFGDIEIGEMD